MRRPDREDVLIARLTELPQNRPETAARLRQLCERGLPELNGHVLSKVMGSLGTPNPDISPAPIDGSVVAGSLR